MATGRSFMVQHLHLGPAGNVRTAIFTNGNLPLPGQLGQVFEEDNKFYRLVQVDSADAVDYIDGGVAYWNDRSAWTVTADASDSELGANGVAGGVHQAIDISTYSADPYIFVQIGGEQAAVVVAASAVAGDHVTGHASTDNVLTRTAAGTAPVDLLVGTAMSTRGTTTSDEGASVSNSSRIFWHIGALM